MELTRSYDNYLKDENGDEEDTNNDEDSEDGDKSQENHQKYERLPETIKPSLAYQDFLRFLQLGCSGSPVEGYPTVVIILSTIPSSVSYSMWIIVRVFTKSRRSSRYQGPKHHSKVFLSRFGQRSMDEH